MCEKIIEEIVEGIVYIVFFNMLVLEGMIFFWDYKILVRNYY